MSIKGKYALTFLVVLLLIVPSIFLGRDVVAPMIYQSKVEKMALDTSPGSVGSPADGSTPIVETLEEMETNDRFVLRNWELEQWNTNQGGTIAGKYYYKVTLKDGTVLAARCNVEAMGREYEYEGAVRIDYDHLIRIYPIGTLRPWSEAEKTEVETADWINYRIGWLDAEGDFGVELPDFQKIRSTYTYGFGIGSLIFGIALCMAVERKLERKAERS